MHERTDLACRVLWLPDAAGPGVVHGIASTDWSWHKPWSRARDCAALHCLAVTVWSFTQPRRSVFKSRTMDWLIARNSGRSGGIRTSRIKLQATFALTGTSCWKTTWQSLDVKYWLISAVILVCMSLSGLVRNEIEKIASWISITGGALAPVIVQQFLPVVLWCPAGRPHWGQIPSNRLRTGRPLLPQYK